jgi:hypothetical protein
MNRNTRVAIGPIRSGAWDRGDCGRPGPFPAGYGPPLLADPLDVQETLVGLEAEPPQRGQVGQPFADAEVPYVVTVMSEFMV